jgi:GNAT superfamily N-acetyltransferase
MDNIIVRRVCPSDVAALASFYAALSNESRRQRFMASGRGIADQRTRSFCSPDRTHEEGFVAVKRDGRGDDDRIVGHLCLAVAGPRSVEVGVAVADALQGRRIGRRLFEEALRWALGHDIDQLVATAFADNWRVLRLLTSAPYPADITDAGSGLVEVTIPLRTRGPAQARSGRSSSSIGGSAQARAWIS